MSVVVEQYNPEWAAQFDKIKVALETYLQGVPYLSIEHVGSTSVPGLVAKPIIDIDIIVTRENVQAASDALQSNGKYDYLGELGIVDRHVFKDPDQNPKRNIYVCIDGVAQTRNHLGLRNTLRANPGLRDEYARVKLDLAANNTNIIDYVEAKGAVIQKILKASGMLTEAELTAIEKANVKGDKFGAIKTERLLLREFVLSHDVPGYHELEGSEENARYQDWEPRTMQQAREMVMQNMRNATTTPRTVWELVVEKEERMIGRVGAKLAQSDKKGEQSVPRLHLWYSFLPSVQGQGYATEATQALIDELVKRQAGKKVELEIECDPRNVKSWKLAEKLGFEKFSFTEKAYESKGEWVDSLVYQKVIDKA
ncbi:GrpB protein-domain-containing protein [Paraphoma chrysanthemicola]|nr:GrpB protein-domain-containing protein [Paraphoma chrysanthemicola]